MRYVSWGIDDAESDRESMYLGGVHKWKIIIMLFTKEINFYF
jgi:hypothetical protein